MLSAFSCIDADDLENTPTNLPIAHAHIPSIPLVWPSVTTGDAS